MYSDIRELLSKFGIDLRNNDHQNINLLRAILNYKYRLNIFKKESKNQMKKKLILIADDDINLNNILKDLFIDIFDVKQVFRGDDVLKSVVKYKPFALILDNDLPGIMGIELIPQIRKVAKYDLKILFHTGNDIDTLINNSNSLMDIDAYIKKPNSLEKIYKKIIHWGKIN